MVGVVIVMIITGLSTVGGVSNLFDVISNGGPQTTLSLYQLIWFIGATIFGCITNHVAKTKEYKYGFLWGYWLGIIGLLVVGLRGEKKEDSATVTRHTFSTPSNVYDPVDHLERITRLHAQGALTDEEFQKQKAIILSRM